LKRPWFSKHLAGYFAVVAAGAAVAIVAGFTGLAARVDNNAYDFWAGLYPPPAWTPESVVVAIDEETLRQFGGMRNIRTILASSLDLIAPRKPAAVALDVILADAGDPEGNVRLEAAMRQTPNLILPCDLAARGWEDPLPGFRRYAAGLGHIQADEDAFDNVSRRIQLEQVSGIDRRWALSLVTFQHARGAAWIEETPDDVTVAGVRIRAARRSGDRPMLIRYPQSGPVVSVADLMRSPAAGAVLTGEAVFLGITALTAARDRLRTPTGEMVPGVEIHRDAFETMAHAAFLTPAHDSTVMAVCLALALAAGGIFWFRGGWSAYAMAGLLLLTAHSLPILLYRTGTVFPYFSAVSAAWLPVVGAATYRYFLIRGELRHAESDKARYRQAIHFVTHEMRTPLTAIQGSSELMGRYALSEDKRKQIAQLINSESKRLAKMIQTFLDVERLSEGQVELKHESFAVRDLVGTCLERVRPVAERKQIRIRSGDLSNDFLTGDRELMEYAVYNLLTNAVKYSPAETEVCVSTGRAGALMRIAVEDQGIGMDAKELKNIFKKFYRTRKAEASGEVGTGIGLSIVEQIVTEHGGRMEVTSQPGRGSTFTIVLPCHAEVAANTAPESQKV
jgi:signal transduction histidine kinase